MSRRRKENEDDLHAITPHAVTTEPHAIQVGDGWAATLIVTGYPAQVGPAWLEPVLAGLTVDRSRLDVALHISPLPAPVAATRLRRTRARLEATRRLDVDKGRLADPTTAVTADDADGLAERLARGQTRLFRVGIYLTVHAPTRPALDEAVAQIRAVAASAMLDTHPATWRHLHGWTSTLPLGHDALQQSRVIDTDALALTFPLAANGLPAPLPGRPAPPGGLLIGTEPTASGRGRGGIVWWDRWAQHNHNTLLLARSGAGKSYLVKLDILRSLYAGVRVAVIDPEDEYPPLAAAVGGTTLALGAPGVRINPLDLPTASQEEGAEDVLSRRALFCHTLLAVLLGEQPPPDERAALDTAITTAYQRAGITTDPTTWTRPAPVLADVETALTTAGNAGDAASRSLAVRLRPWTRGSFKTLFDGPTTVIPTGRLVVWSVRHLPDELRAAGMLLALDAIWRDVDTPPTRPTRRGTATGAHRWQQSRPVRRLVVVDEAWTLLRDGEGALFLYRLAKAARKRHAGLVVVTQDAEDLLASDLGKAVAANAATQILMRQAPQAIDAITATFGLTPTEARTLTTAPRGHGILLGGQHRVAFHAVSSPKEHLLCRGAGEGDDQQDGESDGERERLAKPAVTSTDNTGDTDAARPGQPLTTTRTTRRPSPRRHDGA